MNDSLLHRALGWVLASLVLVVSTLVVVAPSHPASTPPQASTVDAPERLDVGSPLPDAAAPEEWRSPFRLAAMPIPSPRPGRVPLEGRVERPVLAVEPLVPVSSLPGLPASAPLPPYPVVVPVAGVSVAELVDTFAEARGTDRRHLAIDILAPTGTPVLAAASGRVLRMHRSPRGGITLYLVDHQDGYVYYYAHLDAYAADLRVGDDVEAGQLIGYVGHTGNAHESVPHLHFAIWQQRPGGSGWGGRPVNPYLALKR